MSSSFHFKLISNAPYRSDPPVVMVLDLFTQTFDVYVYSPGVPNVFIAPDVVQKLFPGKNLIWGGCQEVKQFQFLWRKSQRLAVQLYSITGLTDKQTRIFYIVTDRIVRGTKIHLWMVAAENCMDAEVRLYDNLFSDEQPDGPDKDFLDCLNPESLTVLTGCKVEPEMRKVAEAFDKQADRTGVNAPTFQFMRVGYFCLDNRDSSAAHMVFNRSVSLKDSFKK